MTDTESLYNGPIRSAAIFMVCYLIFLVLHFQVLGVVSLLLQLSLKFQQLVFSVRVCYFCIVSELVDCLSAGL